jgi:hypothetical protein
MVALDRNIAPRRIGRMARIAPGPTTRWWQRHPEAGLMVGWAVIVGCGAAIWLML